MEYLLFIMVSNEIKRFKMFLLHGIPISFSDEFHMVGNDVTIQDLFPAIFRFVNVF